MKVEMLHVTPEYHKLVESVARVCYQSYHRVNEESHKMLRGIMGKGHLSVASVGNIVFGITQEYDNYGHTDDEWQIPNELLKYKEINNFIRWTEKDAKKNPDSKYDFVVSFNVLTLMDILKKRDQYDLDDQPEMLTKMLNHLMNVDDVRWFVDKDFKIVPSENKFCGLKPTFYNPIVLSEDYTALKNVLTPYELDVHATVTVDILTDRAIGLQMWRHGDMTGGCEMSQRYVDRSEAGYRIPVDLEDVDIQMHKSLMSQGITSYEWYYEYYRDKGVRQGRAKELARNVLPNIETRIIQCRPLRQWKHFFHLRDTTHAQKEMKEDAQALKEAFEKAGVELN